MGSAAPLLQPVEPGQTVPGVAPSSKFSNAKAPPLTVTAATSCRRAGDEGAMPLSQDVRSRIEPATMGIRMSRPPSLWKGVVDVDRDRMIQVMEDPKALLEVMDRAGVWRVGLVNYPSPDVMGFTDAVNGFSAKYASANTERLLPYGGVHPRFTRDPAGDVDRLVD